MGQKFQRLVEIQQSVGSAIEILCSRNLTQKYNFIEMPNNNPMPEFIISPTSEDTQNNIDNAIFKLEEYTRKNRLINKAAAIEELILSQSQESGFNSSSLSGQNLNLNTSVTNANNHNQPNNQTLSPSEILSINQQQTNLMNTLSALSQVQQAQQVQQVQQQASPNNKSGLMTELLRNLVSGKRKMDFSDSNNDATSKVMKMEI